VNSGRHATARRDVPFDGVYISSSVHSTPAPDTADARQTRVERGFTWLSLVVGVPVPSPIVRSVRALHRQPCSSQRGISPRERLPCAAMSSATSARASTNGRAHRWFTDARLRAQAEELEQRVKDRNDELVEAQVAIEQSEKSLAITIRQGIGDAVMRPNTTEPRSADGTR